MSLSFSVFGISLLALAAVAHANALRLKARPAYAASAERQYNDSIGRDLRAVETVEGGFSGAFSARQTARNLGY